MLYHYDTKIPDLNQKQLLIDYLSIHINRMFLLIALPRKYPEPEFDCKL